MLTRFVTEADPDLVLAAGVYSLLDHDGLAELLPAASARGVGVVVAQSLHGGLIDGVTDSMFHYRPTPPDVRKRAERIAQVCRRHGVPTAAAALQFPLGHPAVVGVLTGPATPEQVAQNLSWMRTPVPPELWDDLRSAGLLPQHVPTPRPECSQTLCSRSRVRSMTEVLLLSGVTGRDDPWHDFDATSAAIAATLAATGLDVALLPSGEVRAADLQSADLLVVNCGLDSSPGADSAATAAFVEVVRSDRPVLGVHTAANAFGSVPAWVDRLGVRWVEGVSMHPPIGWLAATVDESHPIGAGLGAVEVFDERYSNLEISRPAEILLVHSLDGLDHPLSVARQDADGRRTVYDALGHGAESYASASRRALLRREVTWLLASR